MSDLTDRVKAKYPQYANIDDASLEQRVLAKYPQYKNTVNPSQPSVGGFAENVGKSAVSNLTGMAEGVAGMFNPDTDKNTLYGMARLAQGGLQKLDPTKDKVIANTIGDAMPLIGTARRVDKTLGRSTDYQPQAEAVGKFYGDRYGGVENIKKTLYEDPVGVALDASVVLGGTGAGLKGAGLAMKSSKLAKAGQIASRVGKVADPLTYLNKSVGAIGSRVKPAIVKSMSKLGSKLEQGGKEYSLRGLRPSQSMQNKFRDATKMNLEDYIEKNDLYGNELSMAEDNVLKYQNPFDELTLRKDIDVPIVDLLDEFDKKIKALKKASIDDPVSGAQMSKLEAQRAKLLEAYYKKVPNKRGGYAIKPKQKARTLEDVVKARKLLDKNTPKSDFGQSIADAGAQRKMGDIYRELQYKYGGNKVRKLGQDLKKAYAFKEVLEKAPKGKGTLPASLTKGAWGAAFNNPIIGALFETVINSPRTIGAVSKGAKNIGKTLQKGKIPKVPNIFKKLLESSKYERIINPN